MIRFGARVISSGPGYISAASQVQKTEIYALKASEDWQRVRLPKNALAKAVIFDNDNGVDGICYVNHSENQLSVDSFRNIADELAAQAPETTHLILGEGNWTSIAGISPRVRELIPDIKIVGYRGERTDIHTNFGLTVENVPFSFKKPGELLDSEEVVTDEERISMAKNPVVAAQHLGRSSIMAFVVAQRILQGDPEARICTMIYDRDDRY
jgi:cysteine synthase